MDSQRCMVLDNDIFSIILKSCISITQIIKITQITVKQWSET
jgi:hypothetical protein